MQKLKRMLINICSKDLDRSKKFYTSLFDFKVNFDSDWFVHLSSEDKGFEMGIIQDGHELVPTEFLGKPRNMYISFILEDVDEFYSNSDLDKNLIIQEPQDTFYGQRRLLIVDPNGVLLDISSPMKQFG